MSALHRIAHAATVLLLGACAKPTDVELRLHACALAGAVPVRVDLEIHGVDAEGAALPVLKDSYEIDPAALADGYATVGLRKPAGLVGADFIITWHDGRGGVEVVELLDRPVPAAGEVLELGAERCMPPDTGTSSSSSGDATTSGSSSTGTETSTGDDTSTGTSTSTGMETTSGTTTTGDTTTTGESTGSSTGETDASTGTTGEETKVGTPCGGNDQFYCEGGAPGQIGTLLHCKGTEWEVGELEPICATLFEDNCPPTLGMVNPVAVGCSGEGEDGLTCVWKDTPAQACDPVGCGPEKQISICDGEERVLAVCSVFCAEVDEVPQCVPKVPPPP